ncbi:MAG TPA: Gfo/Idh/MocA family oxidoreductase [Thermodesulfobacteriota bacterium]|nr:Gfo/Idh/MocA family oxidoreductase [Thermodesulfobacteriota bacterium]
MPINLGLIGCGRIARLVHLSSIKKLHGARLAAVSDIDGDCANAAARAAPGARVYTDYKELLRSGDVDAVVICLPTFLHAEAASEAFDHGKHVYLEKPLAQNSEEAARVMEAWEKSGKCGMSGLNLRFNPIYAALKEKVGSGAAGSINAVRTVFTSSSRNLPEWKRKRETGGGVLLDLASHHADLLRYIFGAEVAWVKAGMESRESEDDNAFVELRMENGIRVQSFFSLNSTDEDKIEVYGSKGKLTADRYNSFGVTFTPAGRARGSLGKLADRLSQIPGSPVLKDRLLGTGREPSFELALGHFAASISGGFHPSPGLADGLASLKIIEAAEESAGTGRAVSTGGRPRSGREEANA